MGTVVRKQISTGRGVRLPGLGTFTMTASGIPTYVHSPEMLKNYKLKVKNKNGVAGNIPATSLNYSQLAQASELSREMCEKIYVRMTQILGKKILEGRDVLLIVHRLAEISIKNGVVSCDFMSSDPTGPGSPGRGASGSAPHSPRSVVQAQAQARAAAEQALRSGAPGVDNGVFDSARERQAARNRKASADEKALQQVLAYKAQEPEPQLVVRNNIFSTGSDVDVVAPPPLPTNPIVHAGETGYDHNPFDDLREYRTKAQLKAGGVGGIVSGASKSTMRASDRRPTSASGGSAMSGGSHSMAMSDTDELLHSPRAMSVASSANGRYGQQPQVRGVRPGGRSSGRPGARPRAVNGSNNGGISRQQLEAQNANTAAALNPDQGAYRKIREADHGGVSAADALMSAETLAAKTFNMDDVMQKVREKIIERGGSGGIRSLQRLLAIMDDNGDKRLSKDELKYGLRDYGIELSTSELDAVFMYFDRDGNGFIDITEFLVGIRGELNARRKKLIRMAFDILDADGSGYITVEEIAEVYDVSQNPDVTMGKKTEREALLEFMGQWEGGDKDGVVTYEEFEDYYKEISASIDGDDFFELMIRNAWRIAGGEGASANTANLRVLVTDKDGKEHVATVEKELGLKQGDREEIRKRLMAQGVDASNVELYGGMDSTEKPKAQRGGGANKNEQYKPKQLESKLGVDVGNPRSAYDRNVAALKLAAAFRGRVGRKIALGEKRKNDAAARKIAEEEAEARLPRAKKLIRPAPKAKRRH